MTHRFADIAFTDSVKSTQIQYDSRSRNERLQAIAGPNDQLSTREIDYIAQRDAFYLATVSETGWPYVQHRGGPKGFLNVLNPTQLAYADFRGNTQLISMGNASVNNRCSLILMDYPNQQRLKVLGRMHIQDVRSDSEDLLKKVQHPEYDGRVERLVVIDVVAFDWNCPQHITRRYSEDEFSVLLQSED
ncbi:MAG: pyridoxamine 5'-phosphate oxidase family protein [Gammaproteobacteria bacterium]|nr:pyridoxamine 5'-phosphate oxidase family protein [Gammaproteobacteria bacterium]